MLKLSFEFSNLFQKSKIALHSFSQFNLVFILGSKDRKNYRDVSSATFLYQNILTSNFAQ